jgi:hypothetical protein
MKTIPWGSLYASEAQGVLCLAWQDNNIVLLLSTIHSPEIFTTTERKRPSATSTNAAIARAPFRDEIKKKLEIPSAINDYNHYMGGVDIANQYRASYEIHRKSERNWFPLLYFFLDAAIVNAFRIQYLYKQQQQASELPSQLRFREKLYQELFTFASQSSPSPTPRPVPVPGINHQRIQFDKQQPCKWCQYNRQKGTRGQRAPRTRSGCLECGNVALCVKGRCWDEFHGN